MAKDKDTSLEQQSSLDQCKSRGKDCSVHPTAVLGPMVIMGDGVTIGAYAVIQGAVYLGDNTKIYPFASIGQPAQDVNVTKQHGCVIIGKNCTIREYVSIHSPAEDSRETHIGDNCYIMAYAHIAHDVFIGNNVTLINNVSLGGYVYISDNAMIMSGVALHQNVRVGKYAAVSPHGGSRQDIPPYCLFDGKPARFAGLNRIALKRAGFSQDTIEGLRCVTRLYFQEKYMMPDIEEHMYRQSDWAQDADVRTFIKFIKSSTRGVTRQTRRPELSD